MSAHRLNNSCLVGCRHCQPRMSGSTDCSCWPVCHLFRDGNKTESFVCHDYRQTSSVTSMLQRLSWDSLQQRRAHNRVWMLYRIRNGLVAIPPDQLKQTTVATRKHETRYTQIRCNSCMYNQTFFPSAVRLWNRVPSDTCYLAPDSFKLELSISSDHAPCFYLTALHDLISGS